MPTLAIPIAYTCVHYYASRRPAAGRGGSGSQGGGVGGDDGVDDGLAEASQLVGGEGVIEGAEAQAVGQAAAAVVHSRPPVDVEQLGPHQQGAARAANGAQDV